MSQYTIGLLFVLASAFMESLGQTCLKFSANANTHGAHPVGVIRTAFSNHWTITGIACFLTGTISWTIALTKLPLNVAFPSGSICFVFVAILSLLLLKERVSKQRWFGIALILAGVALVSIKSF
jgi:multidrug transporter EmrE-like cation transporter